MHTYTCTRTYTHAHTCTHAYVHMHTYTCTRTHAHVHMHTYTCTRTHAHLSFFTKVFPPFRSNEKLVSKTTVLDLTTKPRLATTDDDAASHHWQQKCCVVLLTGCWYTPSYSLMDPTTPITKEVLDVDLTPGKTLVGYITEVSRWWYLLVLWYYDKAPSLSPSPSPRLERVCTLHSLRRFLSMPRPYWCPVRLR